MGSTWHYLKRLMLLIGWVKLLLNKPEPLVGQQFPIWRKTFQKLLFDIKLW